MTDNATRKIIQRIYCLVVSVLFITASSITAGAEVIRSDDSADEHKTGVPLYEWRDDRVKDPRCVVVAIHGAAQQAGALDALGRALAAIGYLVVAPDLRGAGRWNTLTHEKSTGAFGDFVRSCDDMASILKLLRKEHPHSNIYCIGESAGSTVVMSAVVKDPSRIKGIILCSAGSEPKIHNPGTMGPEFYKKLMHVTTPVDMSDFIGHYSSDDSRVSNEMIHDRLGRNKLSALELVGTFNFIQQGTVLAGKLPRTLPALLIQGKEDQIINPNSAVKLLRVMDCTDKNLLMLPGCGHILIGTSFMKEVVADNIIEWLAQHGGMKPTTTSLMPRSAPDFQRQPFGSISGNGAGYSSGSAFGNNSAIGNGSGNGVFNQNASNNGRLGLDLSGFQSAPTGLQSAVPSGERIQLPSDANLQSSPVRNSQVDSNALSPANHESVSGGTGADSQPIVEPVSTPVQSLKNLSAPTLTDPVPALR